MLCKKKKKKLDWSDQNTRLKKEILLVKEQNNVKITIIVYEMYFLKKLLADIRKYINLF